MVVIKILSRKWQVLLIFAFLLVAKEKIVNVNSTKFKERSTSKVIGSQQTEMEVGSATLFDSYSNSLKFLLEGMFGPDYEKIVERSSNAEDLPLCKYNNQMENRGCNVMLYACSKHINNKFSCYFYYWSFCQCSKPWNIRFLNYFIPPIYDCYPSVASEEDFKTMREFNENQIGTSPESSLFSESLEIPVGKCSTNIIFVVWVIVLISISIWLIQRVYFSSCYIRKFVSSSRRKAQ